METPVMAGYVETDHGYGTKSYTYTIGGAKITYWQTLMGWFVETPNGTFAVPTENHSQSTPIRRDRDDIKPENRRDRFA